LTIYKELNVYVMALMAQGQRPWYPLYEKPITFDEYSKEYLEVERIVKATGVSITHDKNQSSAFYYYSGEEKDTIVIPPRNQFADPAEYYVILLHELAHWSESRLFKVGEYDYSTNELIADVVSASLAMKFDIPNRSWANYELYAIRWLKKMESNPLWIFEVVKQANRVCEFLLAFEN